MFSESSQLKRKLLKLENESPFLKQFHKHKTVERKSEPGKRLCRVFYYSKIRRPNLRENVSERFFIEEETNFALFSTAFFKNLYPEAPLWQPEPGQTSTTPSSHQACIDILLGWARAFLDTSAKTEGINWTTRPFSFELVEMTHFSRY